jgi:SagB-type dehydrogenase family enzyme
MTSPIEHKDPKRAPEKWPLTWSYHRNTSRWAYNAFDQGGDATPQPPAEYPGSPAVALPPPTFPTGQFSDLLAARHSCRAFTNAALSLKSLGSILHAGYGVAAEAQLGPMVFLERPVPSGGGLYPLEIYVIARQIDDLNPGIHHFAVITNVLEERRQVKLPEPFLEYLFMGQRQLTVAPALLVITGVLNRCLTKYGDRGYRYMTLEAGHVMQNINLASTALGLGSCNIGGFFDVELAQLLGADPDSELPLYAAAIGHPANLDRMDSRNVDDVK